MVNFAKRMDGMKASDIRELLKLTTRPEIISFAGGLPAPELFPVEDIKAATDAVMDEQGRAALRMRRWSHGAFFLLFPDEGVDGAAVFAVDAGNTA